jgi:hypothetical protein
MLNLPDKIQKSGFSLRDGDVILNRLHKNLLAIFVAIIKTIQFLSRRILGEMGTLSRFNHLEFFGRTSCIVKHSVSLMDR